MFYCSIYSYASITVYQVLIPGMSRASTHCYSSKLPVNLQPLLKDLLGFILELYILLELFLIIKSFHL